MSKSDRDSPVSKRSTSSNSGATSQDKKEKITKLNSNDVLCGRGSGPNDHCGNIAFRKLVSTRRKEYLTTSTRAQKAVIAKEIVNVVWSLDPPGRFLEKAGGEEGCWNVTSEEKALEKVKQALRQMRHRKAESLDLSTANKSNGSGLGGSRSRAAGAGVVPSATSSNKFGDNSTVLSEMDMSQSHRRVHSAPVMPFDMMSDCQHNNDHGNDTEFSHDNFGNSQQWSMNSNTSMSDHSLIMEVPLSSGQYPYYQRGGENVGCSGGHNMEYNRSYHHMPPLPPPQAPPMTYSRNDIYSTSGMADRMYPSESRTSTSSPTFPPHPPSSSNRNSPLHHRSQYNNYGPDHHYYRCHHHQSQIRPPISGSPNEQQTDQRIPDVINSSSNYHPPRPTTRSTFETNLRQSFRREEEMETSSSGLYIVEPQPYRGVGEIKSPAASLGDISVTAGEDIIHVLGVSDFSLPEADGDEAESFFDETFSPRIFHPEACSPLHP